MEKKWLVVDAGYEYLQQITEGCIKPKMFDMAELSDPVIKEYELAAEVYEQIAHSSW